MSTNNDLVSIVANNQKYLRFKSPRDSTVLNALRRVDRREFLSDIECRMPMWIYDREFLASVGISPEMYGKSCIPVPLIAYADIPLEIGFGQTCSAPSMVALMADMLELQPGLKVLEIGTGCGYHAAVTRELIGPGGHLTTIECVPELADYGRDNLTRRFLDNGIHVIQGDGSRGYPQESPYDRIYFTAGVDQEKSTFDPNPLFEQLSPKGIVLIPNHEGPMIKMKLNGMEPEIERIGSFGFVKLQGENS